MINKQLKCLIDNFLVKVHEAESLMKKHLGVEQPYEWRQHGIPRTGEFSGGQYTYSFHGIGCLFSIKGEVINYDYGHDGRIDGFDLWRLSGYGEENDRFKDYIESGKIEKDFNKAIKSGDIKKLFSEQHDDLYYKIDADLQFALVCQNTLEFIDLDEWPIMDAVGVRLKQKQTLDALNCCNSPAVIIDTVRILKSINCQDSDSACPDCQDPDRYEYGCPDCQTSGRERPVCLDPGGECPYDRVLACKCYDCRVSDCPDDDCHDIAFQSAGVEMLIPLVRKFISSPRRDRFFITCNSSAFPWEIGQSRRYTWKENITDFQFVYESRTLPRNLIEDYKLLSWDQVLEFYREKDEWILHEQYKDDLLELKEKYLDLLNKT